MTEPAITEPELAGALKRRGMTTPEVRDVIADIRGRREPASDRLVLTPEEFAAVKRVAAAVPGEAGDGHRPGPKRMLGRRLAPVACWSCGQPWPCDGSWQVRAERAEGKLADLRSLAEGCRELAANGRDLDSNCTASAAYRAMAGDVLAIIGTEEEADHG